MNRALVVGLLLALAACAGRKIRPTTDEKIEATPERIERGRYLVNGPGACGGCHTSREGGAMANPEDADRELGGGNLLVEKRTTLWVPNLSSDRETGLGAWTDDEIMRAIRDGVSRDRRVLFPLMPYSQYQFMSDDDVRAMVAYLRTVPPVKPITPRRDNDVPFPMGLVLGMGVTLHAPAQNVKAPDPANQLAWGKYVAQLGHCMECHGFTGRGSRKEGDRYMAGSDAPFELEGVGRVWATNLTPDPETGLGRASAEQLKAALRSGRRLDGRQMAPPMSLLMPHFALLSETDLDALVAWLRSLPPVKQAVPPRELVPALARQLGD